MASDDADATIRFCNRLDLAGIEYLIGGSVASGMWGDPRFTHDVDLAVWVATETAEVFLNAFDDSYLVSRAELYGSLESSEEFRVVQVLDSVTVLKFDCFIQPAGAVPLEMLQESKVLPFGDSEIRVACAEDILIQKLRWFELTHRTSERQWRDIQGIIRVTADLRWDLINRWAEHYGVVDLAQEARTEFVDNWPG